MFGDTLEEKLEQAAQSYHEKATFYKQENNYDKYFEVMKLAE